MLREIIIAIQSYADAHRFIVRHRLWKWILIPGIIYLLLFVAGIYFFWKTGNLMVEFVFNQSHIKAWLDSVQNSWFKFFYIIGQIVIHFVLLLFYFSLFKYIFLIIGSPVFAYLSEKTENIIEGKDYPFSFPKFISDIVRGVRLAIRNIFWQTLFLACLFLLSVIPLAGWIAPLLALFVECYYVGFSMLDYNSERYNLNYHQSIRFVGEHKGLAIGNGMVYYILHLIPVIGWLFAPSYAVIAATLSIITARKKKIIPTY
jgi:CysZ protein